MRRLLGVLVLVTLVVPLAVVAPTGAAEAAGRIVVVPGHGPTVGSGPLIRYRVAVETGIGENPDGFVTRIRETLGDPRDWGRHNSFRRVSSSPYSFTVVLVSPSTTDRLCYPYRTAGIYSCYNGGRAVINDYRWRHGASTYADHLKGYRIYLLSHEIGHAIGHHEHAYSCRSDGLAPVMMQQTKSLYGCARNPWPWPNAG